MNKPDRTPLQEFISYAEGKLLRNQLHEYALANYVPKHPAWAYIAYMNKHECSFEVNGNQQSNFPYYLTMFSVPSQHIMGDCVEECFDKAFAKVGNQHVYPKSN